MTVAVNLREPPATAEELTSAQNLLHYEGVNLPMSNDFNTILASIKSQLDIFKSSNKQFYLFNTMKLMSGLLPKVICDLLINTMLRQSIKVSITNICGPEAALQFGDQGAQSKEIMFANFFEQPYI